MGELTDESPFNPCLSGHMDTFNDDDASANRTIFERCAYGFEVIGKARVIRLETVDVRVGPAYPFVIYTETSRNIVFSALRCAVLPLKTGV